MRRIYWDTMLFIYLLDDHPLFARRVRELLTKAYERQDKLFTSWVGLGEVMAGSGKSRIPTTPEILRSTIDEMGFSYLPFHGDALSTFTKLRSVHRVKTPDSLNLAAAGAAGVDLFLTGDKELPKLYVPGINFIADFNNPII